MATRTDAELDELFPPLSDEEADEIERRWDENRRTVQRGGRPSSRSAANRGDGFVDDKSTGDRPTRRVSSSSGGGSAWTFDADDGAGLLLGALVYAIGVNFLRYGRNGATGWLRAKFLNRPPIINQGPQRNPGGPSGPYGPQGPRGLTP